LSLTQLGLDPECKWTGEVLAQKLGVIQQTINSWISNIRARHRASKKRASEISGNTNFGNIDNLLCQGRDMEYIARHYKMDLPLARALRLKGKTDQEKFSELGWGLPREIRDSDSERYFTGGCARGITGISMSLINVSGITGLPATCATSRAKSRRTGRERSGEAGRPGQIPAQLVGHTLF